MIVLTILLIIISGISWAVLGWLGSRYMFLYWAERGWTWNKGEELQGRILMFFGPFNFLSAIIAIFLSRRLFGHVFEESSGPGNMSSSWFGFR